MECDKAVKWQLSPPPPSSIRAQMILLIFSKQYNSDYFYLLAFLSKFQVRNFINEQYEREILNLTT